MLYFVQVPLEGFSALQGISGSQKFQIHKAYGSPDHLPSAHTWYFIFILVVILWMQFDDFVIPYNYFEYVAVFYLDFVEVVYPTFFFLSIS